MNGTVNNRFGLWRALMPSDLTEGGNKRLKRPALGLNPELNIVAVEPGKQTHPYEDRPLEYDSDFTEWRVDVEGVKVALNNNPDNYFLCDFDFWGNCQKGPFISNCFQIEA